MTDALSPLKGVEVSPRPLTQVSSKFDRLFIGGEWVHSSGQTMIEVVSPSTEEVIAHVPDANKMDIDRAVAAARRAFDSGPWPRMSVEERSDVLRRVRDALEQNCESIAQLIASELGAPISQSRRIQAAMPVAIADAYLEVARTWPFHEVRHATNGSAIVTHEPVGVVAAVIPWNGPVGSCAIKLFPSLLAGCTVILKPSPEAPLSTYFVAQLMQAAGLPDGVLNVVPAKAEGSEYLVGHPDVNMVTFTGSTATGRRIAEICGRDLRRVALELGGKSAALILDDADLDLTMAALRMGSLRNSGQICSLKTRILVSKRREAEVVDRLSEMVRSMPVGDPFDERTEIGPMVSHLQRDRVAKYQQIGIDEGAVPVVGGGGKHPGFERGYYVDPTLFVRVQPNMRIAQEEIFGPVLSVLAYETEEEAIAVANNSRYGLSGAVFGEDLDHAWDIARRMHTGTVELNGSSAGFMAPAGGVKSSGIGREYGPEGVLEFVEKKAYGLPLGKVDELAARVKF